MTSGRQAPAQRRPEHQHHHETGRPPIRLTTTSPDGTTIAYDRTGAGEPLVLIGGAFSYRRFPGQVKLAQLLSERFPGRTS